MNKRFLTGATLGLFLLAGARFAEAQTQPASGGDNPSAYTALRLVGKNLGHDALERVVEVTGRDGVPQPFLWKIVLKEGTGSREVDVAGGKIEAQRELTRPPSAGSATIRLADLNLDSTGAFDATDNAARKVKLRYDSLNYALRVSPATGKPVWSINLLGKEGGEVGTIRLAAHDGTIISTNGRLANNPSIATTKSTSVAAKTTTTTRPTTRPPVRESTVTSTSTTYHETVPPPAPRVTASSTTTTTQTSIPVATLSDRRDEDAPDPQPAPNQEEGGLFTRTGRTLDKTSHTVNRSFRKAGASVQRFFTGHSDLDQDDRRE